MTKKMFAYICIVTILLFFSGCGSQKNRCEEYLEEGLKIGEQGNPQKALEYFQKAKELDPNNPAVYLAIGSANMYLSNFNDAVSSFKKVLELKPDSGEAYCLLGVVYDLMGNYDKAELNVKKAIDLFEQIGDKRNSEKTRLVLKQINIHKSAK